MGKMNINNNKPCIVCMNGSEANIILNSDTDNYWQYNGAWVHLRRGQKMF
jgi:hypothetical protein